MLRLSVPCVFWVPGRLDHLGLVDGFLRASLSQATAVPCALCELGRGQVGFQRPRGAAGTQKLLQEQNQTLPASSASLQRGRSGAPHEETAHEPARPQCPPRGGEQAACIPSS